MSAVSVCSFQACRPAKHMFAATKVQQPNGSVYRSSSSRSVRMARTRLQAAAGAGGGAMSAPREVLSPQQRSKLDSSDDRMFYDAPRLVHHLDARFRAQLTQLYRERIQDGADVLDLCSSWVSHLPAEKRYGRVVGHGMNAAELGRNPQLTDFFVRNLNAQPSGWALGDASVDAVLCTASIQYMQQPETVLAEAARVLRPGGVLIISFSNRMFYTKAIAAWRDNSDYGRCSLVKSYIMAADAFSEPEVVRGVDLPGQSPLQRLQQWGEAVMSGGSSDPFFAVVAYRR